MHKVEPLLSLVRSGELEIDSDGSVWRLMRRGGNPKRGGIRTTECARHRVEFRTRDGYLLVTATIAGRKVVTGAHRLVWAHTNGPIPDGLTINHKNGVKDDNRPENLELATYSEQRRHAIAVLNVNRNRPKGERNPKAQLVPEQVVEIRRLRATGVMVKDLAATFGMKKRAVSAICCRRTWKHL